MLLSRNVQNMSSFFTEIIGLRLVHLMPDGSFAELRDWNGFQLMIKKINPRTDLAKLQYGYAPVLNFEISANEDLEGLVERACGVEGREWKGEEGFKCYQDGDVI